jgi:hypothetical protein
MVGRGLVEQVEVRWRSLGPELGDLEEQSGHGLKAVFNKHCKGRREAKGTRICKKRVTWR